MSDETDFILRSLPYVVCTGRGVREPRVRDRESGQFYILVLHKFWSSELRNT